MEKRDIFGKKQYKELLIQPAKINLSHYCFIAIRTELEQSLNFFTSIYQNTNYLFQLSKSVFDIDVDDNCFSFRSFEFKDTVSEHSAFCLVNKSVRKKQYLFGKDDKRSCYILPKQKTKNQISFSFQQENEPTEKSIDENDWDLFKRNIQDTSVNLMDKIDYIFPVEIRTYEILKPLFLNLPNIPFLNHQFIDPKNIRDMDTFFHQWCSYLDKLKDIIE